MKTYARLKLQSGDFPFRVQQDLVLMQIWLRSGGCEMADWYGGIMFSKGGRTRR